MLHLANDLQKMQQGFDLDESITVTFQITLEIVLFYHFIEIDGQSLLY